MGGTLRELEQAGEIVRGLCVCGSGIGISMAANKIPGVRAALVHDSTEARLARQHNDANVLCLGQRTVGEVVAEDALKTFLTTEFEAAGIRLVSKNSGRLQRSRSPSSGKARRASPLCRGRPPGRPCLWRLVPESRTLLRIRKMIRDAEFMRLALAEAARAMGRTSPNPAVGCVIVKNGRVLARGRTQPPGRDHAEVNALKKCDARGATVYVTLEPCNHVGRTGKCSEALIAAGVKRVVIGMKDPNPGVAGGGAKRLRAAGVTVELGVLEAECRQHLRHWTRWVTGGRPWVTMKAAVTLDGRLAARGGDSKWVSGEASRKHAHALRDRVDAVLVGARTVALDDPQLTTRAVRGRDPKRVILDGRLSIPATARALPGALVISTLDCKPRADLAIEGVEIVQVPGKDGRVDLGEMLNALGRRGITWLLVEGGGQVHGQLLAAGLVDDVMLYVAPKLIGAGGVPLIGVPGPRKMAEAWRLSGVQARRLGDDILVTGAVVRDS